MSNIERFQKGIVLRVIMNYLKTTNQIIMPDLRSLLVKEYPKLNWPSTFLTICLQEFCESGIISYTTTFESPWRTYFDPHTVLPKAKSTPKKAKATKTSKSPKKDKWSTSARISKTKALNMMQNNKGRFFSVQFTKKKDKTLRTMNCQYLSGQTVNIGVVKVKEACLVRSKDANPIRSFDLNTLKKVSINGQVYNVR